MNSPSIQSTTYITSTYSIWSHPAGIKVLITWPYPYLDDILWGMQSGCFNFRPHNIITVIKVYRNGRPWFCLVNLNEIRVRVWKLQNRVESSARERISLCQSMGPTWGPPGSWRPQMGPMLTPWILLSGKDPRKISKDGGMRLHGMP